jgi:beta-phosphoglucomutase-like phosphatase (HAD superfamily)
VVVTADQVAEPKPSPDAYLRACELLGAAPSRSIALEDSPTGVAAARAAGMFVIGIPSFPGVLLDEADLVGRSLTDPRVREALALD